MSSMILLGETIPQDSVLTFAPSSNAIGATGQRMLQAYMRSEGLPEFPSDWTWLYNVPPCEDRYKGKFSKRAGKYVHDETGDKMTGLQRETLGRLARDNSATGTVYNYDVTERLDWQAGDYGDYGSCFWESNAGAREAMDDDERFYALRFYDDNKAGDSRAWLFRLDRDAVIIFNAYGSIELLEMASMLCQLRGPEFTYKRIDLSNFSCDSSDLYINSGRGYLVCNTDHEMAHDDAYDFELDCPNSNPCERCGYGVDEYNSYYVEGHGSICESCYSEHFFNCESCNEDYHDDYGNHVKTNESYKILCDNCFDEDGFECIECGEEFMLDDEAWRDADGDGYCTKCYDEKVVECTNCGDMFNGFETAAGDSELCQECFDSGVTVCARCSMAIPVADAFPGVGEHKGKETCRMCTAAGYGYVQLSLTRYKVARKASGEHYAVLIFGLPKISETVDPQITEQWVLKTSYHVAMGAVRLRAKFQAVASA